MTDLLEPGALVPTDDDATAPAPARGRSAVPPARGIRTAPHLRHERVLLREGARLVAGMDEVGRGSLAGPVSVGVVVIDASTRSAPQGVADSKLLTAAARQALVPRLRRWGLARAVGHASAAEIDEIGIIAALRLAGTRALSVVAASVGPVDVVLLDGSHDWLTAPAQGDLFAPEPDVGLDGVASGPRVVTRVKADRTCATVAAASVLAKCERDGLMAELAGTHPHYGWDENKGYASPGHVAALHDHGPCELHRRSWRLPGIGGWPGGDELAAALAAGDDAALLLAAEGAELAADDEFDALEGGSLGEAR
ncbi:ribonuclease HII [Cellulomonas alba]|uniref:Ribonuclease n=1 Tax=Cellulomonas alba TaxID=3053467 RepID=A0ABT7SIR2_9CELL|nr:ribonuclease HII [Cellulomonas alba]MDM7856075.1 ribonuclease HII [Cellulomonas alba]